MSKPRVFITRLILESGLQLVQDFCEVVPVLAYHPESRTGRGEAEIWSGELPPSRAELLRRIPGLDGLLCLLTDRIDAEVMDAAGPGLKVISNCAVGVDNVDVPAATARGIPVGNTPGVLTDATADFAFALLMAAGRRVVEGERQVRSGGWKTWSLDTLLGADFAGATLGLVGFGRIGRAVARRATGFGMRIIFSDPNPAAPEPGVEAAQVDFDTLLRESDFVSLHTPLTDETRGLMNAAAFAKMKPTSVLVNTSRGPVVDQSALYEALKSHHIFAAALDVTVPEPLPTDSPLLALENCIIVPHIASASWQARQKMSRMAAENLIAGLKGERLPNCVNPEVYEGRK
ncbi:MAG: D-glycerate dehydrogenase [Candidatus Atribacteria bacterium]|nr:D-glycerate dehydrogenase [Candidatus Atribacteria bacterium]